MPAPDIDVRGVARAGMAIGIAIAMVVGSVLLLLRAWQVSPGADRVRLPYELVIEGPVLQSAPQPELAAELARKARLLDTSGWVDSDKGVVRIPIDTAMRLLVEQGAAGGGRAAAVSAQAGAAMHPLAPTDGAASSAVTGKTRIPEVGR